MFCFLQLATIIERRLAAPQGFRTAVGIYIGVMAIGSLEWTLGTEQVRKKAKEWEKIQLAECAEAEECAYPSWPGGRRHDLIADWEEN